MFTTQRAGLFLLVAFSVIAGAAWQATEKPQRVQKWEYKQVKAMAKYSSQPDDIDEKAASSLGEEGSKIVWTLQQNGNPDRLFFSAPSSSRPRT